jgi:hypothetical protein
MPVINSVSTPRAAPARWKYEDLSACVIMAAPCFQKKALHAQGLSTVAGPRFD